MSAKRGANDIFTGEPKRHVRSLGWHLAVLGTGLLVPVLLFIAVLMWQVVSSERARNESNARAAATGIAAGIDGKLAGLIVTARGLATDPALVIDDLSAFRTRAQTALQPDAVSVAIVDADGRILDRSSLVSDPAGDEQLRAQLRTMILTGQSVSNLIAGTGGGYDVAVRVPIPGRSDRASLAILVRADTLLDGILTRGMLQGAHEAVVFDRTGQQIANWRDDGAEIEPLMLRDLTQGMNATFTTTLHGEQVLAGVSRSLASNWTVLAIVPSSVVQAPINRVLVALATLGVTLLGLAASSTYILGSRAAKVTRGLRTAAAQLGRGELPKFSRTGIREIDEVGEALAAAGIGLREREAALRENAAYVRRVLDNLPLLVAVLDLDGTLVEINAAPLRLAGIEREELIGRKFWDCQWWQSNGEAQRRVREAIEAAREGRTSRFDIPARIRNGAEIIIDCQIAPLRDAKGNVVALIPSAIDVSERERAIRELREGAERLRLAIEAGQLGSWDLDIAADVCIYSQRTCEMLGLSSPTISRAEFRKMLHPDDRKTTYEAVRRTVEEGSPYQVEFRFIRPDGEMRWIASQGLLRRDREGRPERIIGVHTDISARRLREDELQRNIELLKIIGETTPDLIVVKDAQARYRFVNPAMARILGKDTEDLVGFTTLDGALDPEEAMLLHANDLHIMQEGRSQTIEESITVPARGGSAGMTRIFLSTKTPMRNRLGDVVGLVGVSTDITDRKRAEERQAMMVRELHHRVKNSLATVQAIANSTARTATDIDSFREAFNQRVISLARTHTLLAENSWGVIPLRELLVAELEPYRGGDEMRVAMNGPDVALPSDVALSLGMAVHELTTNAVKYGALSSSSGFVAVDWRVETTGESRQLRLSWVERGGPTVAPPSRQGFGSRLLRHMLGGQFNGKVDMSFEPEGLRFSVAIPLVEESVLPVEAAQ